MSPNFEYRHGIAGFQIVAFSVFLPTACWIAWRKKNGWFCVSLLSLIRLVGASCLLATLRDNSRGVWAAVFVCESLGALLLTFLLFGILERCNRFVMVVDNWYFRIPWLISSVGIGLSVADFLLAAKQENASTLNSYGIAGLAMFLVIFFWTVALFVLFWRRRADFLVEESRQIPCVAVCLPVLAVRIAYTLIDRVSSVEYRTFNPINGDPTAYMFMTAFTEVTVMGVCAWTILRYGRDWRFFEKGTGEPLGRQRSIESLERLQSPRS